MLVEVLNLPIKSRHLNLMMKYAQLFQDVPFFRDRNMGNQAIAEFFQHCTYKEVP
jgi:CRP-like cAMP-binding protein